MEAMEIDEVSSDTVRTMSVDERESQSGGQEEAYTTGGGKFFVHGYDYQLKLLMLFAWKAMKSINYEVDFRLATEMRDSDWDVFDDLVLRYSQDGVKCYRYLQAKHCYFGDKKIKISDLKSMNNNDEFSLQKYFKSYLIIEQKLKAYEHLEDVIICTNWGFDFKNFSKRGWMDFFEEKEDEDPVLNVGGKIYKFKESKKEKVKNVLKPVFEEALQENQGNFERASEVKEKNKRKKRRLKTFLDDLSEFTGNKDEPTLLNECLDKIGDFLDKLVFAVEQPSGAELDKIIKKNIGDKFNLINSSIYNDFHKYMYDWMKDYRKDENNKNVACFLTRNDLKKFFDDTETKIASLGMVSSNLLYKGKIYEYGITFKDNIEEMKNIQNFVIAREEQLLMIYQSKPLLTGIKVFQVLSNMKTKHYKQDEYICSNLKSLSILKGSSADPIKMFESDSRNLVIIEHNTREKEIILNSFFNVLVGKPEKKIIIITSEEQKANTEDVLNDWLEELADDEKIKWTMLEDKSNKLTDLTDESQTMLLNKEGTVIFQGNEVSLGTLIEENKKHLISGEVLFKVINGEKIEIGPKLENQNYNEIKKFYIDRKFTRYVNSIQLHSIKDKVVIIVAEPGMGKSTILSHIAQHKSKSPPSLMMMLQVNLVSHSTEFKKMMKSNGIEELFKLVYKIFLNYHKEHGLKSEYYLNSEKITIVNNELSCTKGEECKMDDVSWFKIQLFNQYYNQGKIVFMFDGYDEISPNYKAIVIDLFKVLKHSKAKMLITTRPYNIVEELENELGVSSYTLKPFSEDDKKTYLKKFWGFDDERSDRFVKEFVERLSDSVNLYCMKDFLSNPLQLYMLALVFNDKVKESCNSDKNMFNYDDYTELILSDFSSVYTEFFKIKFYDIYIKSKHPEFNTDVPGIESIIGNEYDKVLEDHKKLAAYSLLDECEVTLFLSEKELKHDIPKKIEEIKSAKEKTGIITHVADNKPVFVHRTFAEYFLSLIIYDKLVSGADYKVCKFLLGGILLDDKYQVVRRFLNGSLKDYNINENTSENIMKALETTFALYLSLPLSLDAFLDSAKKMEELKEMANRFQENHPNWLENIPKSIKSELERRIDFTDFIEILDSFNENKSNWLEYIADDEKRDVMTKILDELCYEAVYHTSPLHVVSRKGFDVIVEFLLEKHPKHIIASYYQLRKDFINDPDKYDYTALDLAVVYGNKNTVRLLLRNGALISRDTICRSNEEMYTILIEYFSRDNVIVPSNHPSKYFPKLDLSISVVNEQIEQFGINHQGKDGDTLLHEAIRAYNYELATFLINQGADVNIKNSSTETPLSLAGRNFWELIRYFPLLYDCPACNPPSTEDLVDESLIKEPSPLMLIIQNICGQHLASKTLKQSARIYQLLLDKGTDKNELRKFRGIYLHIVVTEGSLDSLAAKIKLTPSNVPLICTTCKREFSLTK